MRAALVFAALAVALPACAQTPGAALPPSQPDPQPIPVFFDAPLLGATGAPIGTVRLTQAPGGVLVRVEATGLPQGWRAMHFHAKADCSDPGQYQRSGGHLNHAETKAPHGLLNPQGPDFGDLPNLYTHADGVTRGEAFTPLVSFKGEGGRAGLMDADGSALVIHAAADDHQSQPIGGAGARVACAAFPPA